MNIYRSIYIYIYIHTHIYVYIYTYIHAYILYVQGDIGSPVDTCTFTIYIYIHSICTHHVDPKFDLGQGLTPLRLIRVQCAERRVRALHNLCTHIMACKVGSGRRGKRRIEVEVKGSTAFFF